jgi:hypothetical protein
MISDLRVIPAQAGIQGVPDLLSGFPLEPALDLIGGGNDESRSEPPWEIA